MRQYANARYFTPQNSTQSFIMIEIDGVEWCVPLDPANTDYQNIMSLVEAGELTIAPAEGA